VGPTCSGKTSLALEVARHLELEIVSADSRQIYRRLNIGTAKPTGSELGSVPHHLIDVVGPEATFSAARFAREANDAVLAVRGRGKTPLLVGGSGLYLRAVEEGFFEGPEAEPRIRARWEAFAEEKGNPALHAKLAEVDSEAARRIHPSDRVRAIRALEVHELTGLPLSEHHRRHARRAPARQRFLRFGIRWSTPALERRIEARVRSMLASGWVREVEGLLESGVERSAPGMRAIGYPEICQHLEACVDLETLHSRITLATRQFAKRQSTWFRAVRGIRWFEVRSEGELAALAPEIARTIEKEGLASRS
jgi:tRNA dimethylallyltransferase